MARTQINEYPNAEFAKRFRECLKYLDMDVHDFGRCVASTSALNWHIGKSKMNGEALCLAIEQFPQVNWLYVVLGNPEHYGNLEDGMEFHLRRLIPQSSYTTFANDDAAVYGKKNTATDSPYEGIVARLKEQEQGIALLIQEKEAMKLEYDKKELEHLREMRELGKQVKQLKDLLEEK